MKRLFLRKTAALTLVAGGFLVLEGGHVRAAVISGLQLTDNSTANEATVTGSSRLLEWHTASSFTPVVTLGDDLSFTHQMQFYNGYHVPVGGSGFALTHKRNLVYDLAFTIEDPSSRGYSVDVATLLRGYSTAQWLAGTSSDAVIATGVGLSGRIDTDTGDATDTLGTQLNGLTVSTTGVTANQSNVLVNSLGEVSDQYVAGNFVGTRSFTLRFTTVPTPTTNVFLQNNQSGQGSIRYGLANSLSGLDPTGQSQAGDIFSDNADLGHFITVTAAFNPAVVPEPSTVLLFAAWLAHHTGRRRRRRPPSPVAW